MLALLKSILKKNVQPKAQPGVLPPSWLQYKDYVEIHPKAIIAPTSTLTIFNCPDTPKKMLSIGEGSHIFGHFALLRENAAIEIGKNCQIGASHFIAAEKITVEDDVLMAWGITLMDSDTHSLEWQHRQQDVKNSYADYLKNPSNIIASKNWNNVKILPITIGSKSWIGFNAIVLKGVELAEETIVGAGAVVTNSILTKAQAIAGNPAKIINKKAMP